MFRKITAKALAVMIAAAIVIGTFAVSAKASQANPYAGTWVSSVQGTGVTATMNVAENGTVCVVFSNQPNVGYYYDSVIWDDGSLVVINGSETVAAFGMYSQNQLLDLDSTLWTRTA